MVDEVDHVVCHVARAVDVEDIGAMRLEDFSAYIQSKDKSYLRYRCRQSPCSVCQLASSQIDQFAARCVSRLTVRKCRLFACSLRDEEPPRTLESKIAEYGGDPLELRRQLVGIACAKRRALSRILWIELQDLVDLR